MNLLDKLIGTIVLIDTDVKVTVKLQISKIEEEQGGFEDPNFYRVHFTNGASKIFHKLSSILIEE